MGINDSLFNLFKDVRTLCDCFQVGEEDQPSVDKEKEPDKFKEVEKEKERRKQYNWLVDIGRTLANVSIEVTPLLLLSKDISSSFRLFIS